MVSTLIVRDEEAVGWLLKQILERAGYQPDHFNYEYVLKVHGKGAYTCHQQRSTNQIRA